MDNFSSFCGSINENHSQLAPACASGLFLWITLGRGRVRGRVSHVSYTKPHSTSGILSQNTPISSHPPLPSPLPPHLELLPPAHPSAVESPNMLFSLKFPLKVSLAFRLAPLVGWTRFARPLRGVHPCTPARHPASH